VRLSFPYFIFGILKYTLGYLENGTEGSLEETKRVVRHKLKLASDADVGLEQWREGRLIDLEDGMFLSCFDSHSLFHCFYSHIFYGLCLATRIYFS